MSKAAAPHRSTAASNMADSSEKERSANIGALKVDRVSKRFGTVEVVRDVSIDLQPGTILSLLGPSGCGKTTVLRMIAGLLTPTRGTICVDGEDMTPIPPHRRNVGMVFQNYALFPHMTVAENVGFGLKMQGVSREAAQPRIAKVLSMVRMSQMTERFPSELSGGQQQRVSLARAIVTQPRLLLLDEPFGALDRRLREEMQIEIKQIQRDLGLTFVFVTHDQEEALTLSDSIAVMRSGQVEQIGSPSEIFNRPKTQFVAEFFGTLNTMPVDVRGKTGMTTTVTSPCGQWSVENAHETGARGLFAVRASDTHFSRTIAVKPAADNSASGAVEDVIYKGNSVLCRVRLIDGSQFIATGEPDAAEGIAPGDLVTLSWSPRKAFLFSNGAAADGRA